MANLIFDFSSSPEGGSLRRLHAFADYFADSPIKTHFFISSGLKDPDRVSTRVATTLVSKGVFGKLLVSAKHLEYGRIRPKWLYSYGLPIRKPVGEKNWMHVSNVLPFCFRDCTLDRGLARKSRIQEMQFRAFAKNNDVVSGESRFSIDCYKATTGFTGETFLARNGLTPLPRTEERKEAFALAIGTHSYKRLDLTYKAYLAVKGNLGLRNLLIVGNPKSIPANVLEAADVICNAYLTQDELTSALNRASVFISTSEVENSSLAVLEGLTLTGRALLSDIPSHREMLDGSSVREFQIDGRTYLDVSARRNLEDSFPQWKDEIENMLFKMGF